jgi:(p)ppGpp synthase/HD superfamily hydrolase
MATDQIVSKPGTDNTDMSARQDQCDSAGSIEELQGLLEQAISIATKAHCGQRDKAGFPYILHPLRLMLKQKSLEAMIAAVLHDVVEDSSITISDLEEACFPGSVIQALTLLTHDKEQPYPKYIEAIGTNKLAIQVKLADLQDNMDLSRIPNPRPKDYARLERYSLAYQYLSSVSDSDKAN